MEGVVKSSRAADFLVIGAGVIGLNIAKELASRHHGAKVVVIDKENQVGMHASGRNSGVLHAGFYYTADSLKARFSRQGNLAMTEFCDTRGLRINKCGKLVVARNETELQVFDILMERARRNGVKLVRVGAAEATEIEPRLKTFDHALFSPNTSSINPLEVLNKMVSEAEEQGISFHLNTVYLGRANGGLKTNKGQYHARYVINAAGLYADRIAKDFGFSREYYLLPFKGLYLYSSEPVGSLSTNIYPVPNLANPFLGVHFTVAVDGRIKVGPTAIPAFWREQYAMADNFNLNEFLETLTRQATLLFSANFNFRKLAAEELCKYNRRHMVELASELAEGVRQADYRAWGKPGIRAQLINRRTKKLEMDFIIEGDDRSMHVLNAVSPAFTCSIPFSKFVVDRIDTLL